VFLLCILQAGDTLTIPELMEEQRARVRSSDPAERFAAALLLSGVLRERLRELGALELGQVLYSEVCSSLSVLAPELTVCMEAADRLCRRGADKTLRPRRSQATKDDDGDHLLHAESALYWARIPHLLLPSQRNKFASDTFMVPSVSGDFPLSFVAYRLWNEPSDPTCGRTPLTSCFKGETNETSRIVLPGEHGGSAP
jgi:hypothetical protein